MDTEPLDIFKVPLCRSYVTAVAQKNRIMRQFNSEESAPKRKRRYKKRKPTRHPDYCVCGALLADGKCEILTVNRVEFCSVRDYPLYRKARDKNNEDVRKYRKERKLKMEQLETEHKNLVDGNKKLNMTVHVLTAEIFRLKQAILRATSQKILIQRGVAE